MAILDTLAPPAVDPAREAASNGRETARPVRYPERDGKPLAETQVHLDQIVYLLSALQLFFASVPDMFVAADLLLYYVQGDRKHRVAPDVFVARGVRDAKRPRRTYLLWDEGQAPEVVFEITSLSTRKIDTGPKRALYQRLGVREYFLFDPLGEYLSPALQGYRLDRGRYEAMEATPDGSLRSESLGLELRQRGSQLRLVDPVSGRWLPTLEESEAERNQLAAEVARLRTLLNAR